MHIEETYIHHKTVMWRTLLLAWFLINFTANLKKIAVPVGTGNGPGNHSSELNGSAAILDSYKYLSNWSELLNVSYSVISCLCCYYSKCNISTFEIFSEGSESTIRSRGRNSFNQLLSDELQKLASNTAILVSVLYYTFDSPKWDYIYVNKHLLNSVILTVDQVLIGYRRINFFNVRIIPPAAATLDAAQGEAGDQAAGADGMREADLPAGAEADAPTTSVAINAGSLDASDAEPLIQREEYSDVHDLAIVSGNSNSRPTFHLGRMRISLTKPSLTLKQYYSTIIFLIIYAIVNIAVTKISKEPVYNILDWNTNFAKSAALYSLIILVGVPLANLYYYFIYFISGQCYCCSNELEALEWQREQRLGL